MTGSTLTSFAPWAQLDDRQTGRRIVVAPARNGKRAWETANTVTHNR